MDFYRSLKFGASLLAAMIIVAACAKKSNAPVNTSETGAVAGGTVATNQTPRSKFNVTAEKLISSNAEFGVIGGSLKIRLAYGVDPLGNVVKFSNEDGSPVGEVSATLNGASLASFYMPENTVLSAVILVGEVMVDLGCGPFMPDNPEFGLAIATDQSIDHIVENPNSKPYIAQYGTLGFTWPGNIETFAEDAGLSLYVTYAPGVSLFDANLGAYTVTLDLAFNKEGVKAATGCFEGFDKDGSLTGINTAATLDSHDGSTNQLITVNNSSTTYASDLEYASAVTATQDALTAPIWGHYFASKCKRDVATEASGVHRILLFRLENPASDIELHVESLAYSDSVCECYLPNSSSLEMVITPFVLDYNNNSFHSVGGFEVDYFNSIKILWNLLTGNKFLGADGYVSHFAFKPANPAPPIADPAAVQVNFQLLSLNEDYSGFVSGAEDIGLIDTTDRMSCTDPSTTTSSTTTTTGPTTSTSAVS